MNEEEIRLYEFLEVALDAPDLGHLVVEIESFAARRFRCGSPQLRPLGQGHQGLETQRLEHRVPLYGRDGTLVAYLDSEEPIVRDFDLFLKFAGWALRKHQLLQIEKRHSELLQSLRLAQTIVEEGLPTKPQQYLGWEVYGQLRPSAHIGGDLFATLATHRAIHFLLLDAVGHGIHSALLATQCRALWRGVTLGREFAESVSLLNRLLCENSGPERFVCATLGACYADGTVEYVACGQSPVFQLSRTGVHALETCEPPLGLFPEIVFEVQKLRLAAGEGLICMTDGILEWSLPNREMFGEPGVIAALQTSDLRLGSEPVVEHLLQSVSAFGGQDLSPQRDDVCCLALKRL